MNKVLSEIIKSVNDNVDGQWSDWESVEHICDTYCIEAINDLNAEEYKLIEDAILTNGAILTAETLQRHGLNGL